jgi:hypothetical protein
VLQGGRVARQTCCEADEQRGGRAACRGVSGRTCSRAEGLRGQRVAGRASSGAHRLQAKEPRGARAAERRGGGASGRADSILAVRTFDEADELRGRWAKIKSKTHTTRTHIYIFFFSTDTSYCRYNYCVSYQQESWMR